MSQVAALDKVLRHVYSEPRHVALVEYLRDYLSPVQQMLGQIPREAVEGFIDGEGWPDDVGEREVSVVLQDPMPDWDWWEPRHDQPWRRQQARDRDAGF